MFELFDTIIAERLEVSIDSYIEVIEEMPFDDCKFIIENVISDDTKDLELAKERFNSFK